MVEDGQIVPAGLRHELLTREDLMAQLRSLGIEDPVGVSRAQIEANRNLSVIAGEA